MKKLVDVRTENVRLFNTLSIETGSRCNRKCKFCFCGHYERPDVLLEMDILVRVCKELGSINYNGLVELQGFDEPMRDKRIENIIKLFKKFVPKSSLLIATNGDYIKNKQDIKKLFNAGLNQLVIDCYDPNKDRMLKMVEYCFDLKENDFKDLNFGGKGMYSSKKSKTIDVIDKSHMLERDNRSLFNYDHKDKKYNDCLANNAGALLGKVTGLGEPNQNKYCVLPFRKATIAYTGMLTLCCQHATGEVNFGDLRKNTLIECWNSDIANEYRLFLQNNMRKNLKGCENCSFFGGFYPHMITKVTFGEEMDEKLLS